MTRWESFKELCKFVAVVGGAALLIFGGIAYGVAREYMEWKTMRAIQHQKVRP